MSASEPAKAPPPDWPALDERERGKQLIDGPFAPEGYCTWCDKRRGWVKKQPRARAAPQRLKIRPVA